MTWPSPNDPHSVVSDAALCKHFGVIQHAYEHFAHCHACSYRYEHGDLPRVGPVVALEADQVNDIQVDVNFIPTDLAQAMCRLVEDVVARSGKTPRAAAHAAALGLLQRVLNGKSATKRQLAMELKRLQPYAHAPVRLTELEKLLSVDQKQFNRLVKGRSAKALPNLLEATRKHFNRFMKNEKGVVHYYEKPLTRETALLMADLLYSLDPAARDDCLAIIREADRRVTHATVQLESKRQAAANATVESMAKRQAVDRPSSNYFGSLNIEAAGKAYLAILKALDPRALRQPLSDANVPETPVSVRARQRSILPRLEESLESVLGPAIADNQVVLGPAITDPDFAKNEASADYKEAAKIAARKAISPRRRRVKRGPVDAWQFVTLSGAKMLAQENAVSYRPGTKRDVLIEMLKAANVAPPKPPTKPATEDDFTDPDLL
jgi:hypothetical protein